MKICQACGRQNAVAAGVCAFCGERFARSGYEASVEAGLRRLEAEKLKFLSPGSVFSKFDPETVAAFEPQPPAPEHDVYDASETRDDFLRDAILSDDVDLDQTTAYDKNADASDALASNAATIDDIDSEDASSVFTADDCLSHDSLSDAEIREAVLDDSPSDIAGQSSFTTLNFAAIRNFSRNGMTIPSDEGEQEATNDETSDAVCEILDDLEAEETHAINSDAAHLTVADMCMSLEPDAPPPPPPPRVCQPDDDDSSVQELDFNDDSSVQELSLNDVEVLEDVSNVAPTLTPTDESDDRDATCEPDATAENAIAKIGEKDPNAKARKNADFGEIKTHDLQAPNASGRPRAKILKLAPAASRNLENENGVTTDRAVTAIEKLKQIGVFDPVQHSEVNRSINSAKRQSDFDDLDSLIPPSKIEFIVDPSSEISTVANQEALDIPEADITAASYNDDNDDKTHNQSPDAVDEIKYAAMLASSAKDPGVKAEHGPEVLPTSDAYNTSLDNRETLSIGVAPSIEQLKSAKNKTKRRTEIDLPIAPETAPAETESAATSALWIALIVVLLGLIGVLLYLMGLLSFISPALAPRTAPTTAKIESEAVQPTPLAIRQSIARVSFQMQMITDPDIWLDSWVEQKVSKLSAEQRKPILSMARDLHPREWNHWKQSVEDSLSLDLFDDSRDMLFQARRHVDMNAEQLYAWNALFYRSFSEDPHFIQPAQLITEADCDEIAPLGGGSTLTFKLRKDGANIAALKPHQTRLQSNYRSEIAAWRLCELLDCAFDIPWNREVKIEKSTFYKLFERSRSSKKAEYRPQLKDIIWQNSDGKPHVFATLKDWVAKFTRFPIEYTALWKPWLRQTDFIESFPTLKDGLKPLRALPHTKDLYDDILALSPSLDTKTLAAQISEVLTFDFLIGNWDRFSGVKTWWGVNCQFADDKIVSIDNGASFPAYSNDKVRERFMMTERFSAHFIERLRILDKEETKKLLFPNATEHETKRFEQFWSQRAAVLKRIDTLSELHGVERVLSFE